MDGFTACPATVGGQGPCSQAADHPPYNGSIRKAVHQPLCLAACPAAVGEQWPCSQAADHPLCN